MAASASAPVWIQGESGTGKELAAAAIHAAGPRARNPYEAINCAALPENLIESELFGVERGAFTGALKSRAGAFARANGGTLFLDEVGELPLGAQAKLLRALESGEVRPVGGDRAIKVDVRVVCASWKDLEYEVAQGRFRHDLLHRLWVLKVDLPPLRTRPDDLQPILDQILSGRRDGEGNHENGECGLWPGPGLLARLMAQAWPGNIRELKNCALRALATNDVHDLLPTSGRVSREPGRRPDRKHTAARKHTDALTDTLEQFGGNRSRSARALGVSRSTLYRWIDEAGLMAGRQPAPRVLYDH
jgi:DNA-binding NtrC family response regulator